MRHVFDAHAILAFLQREKGFEKVKFIMEKDAQKGSKALITAVNWGEVYYIIKREEGTSVAEAMIEIIDTLPLKIIPADRQLCNAAAELKADKKMSYADCFAAAAAIINRAALITGDKEFKEVEGEVKIIWI